MKKNIFIFLGLFLFIVSCEKRKYPSDFTQLEEQDIFVNGYVGNEPLNLSIGSNGYYCYTSYQQSVDSIYTFKGELRKFNCQPCPKSLKVELSDYRQRTPGAMVPIDSIMAKGNRKFSPALAKSNTVKFSVLSNKAVSSMRWQLSNGVSSEDSELSYAFVQPGPQTVSLTVRTTGNCESMVVNKIFIGKEKGLFACSVSATSLQNNGSDFKSALIGGTAPFTYQWNFGDGTTSNLKDPLHTYKYGGSYPVKLRVVDAENQVCESNYIQVVANDQSSCASNMSLTYVGSQRVSLHGVKIQWTDAWNTVLRSDSIAQPAESYFEILSSEPYAANEKGEAGQLLTLRINVLLANGSRRVWLMSDNARIAVAYK